MNNREICFSHDNIVGSHLCDECMNSNEMIVCHRILSILSPLEQVCSMTKECQVNQFVPDTSISGQFASILFDNSPTDSSSSSLKIIQART